MPAGVCQLIEPFMGVCVCVCARVRVQGRVASADAAKSFPKAKKDLKKRPSIKK